MVAISRMILAFLVALQIAACTTPQLPGPDVGAGATASYATEQSRAAIGSAMAADNIPGMAVAVFRDGEFVWSEAFGVANLETGAAATTKTKFRTGSIAKLFTANLAARLAEDGVIDLDSDIRRYLPAFPDKGATITLRQLLGHLGGIRHYAPQDYDFTAPGGPIDVRLYLDAAAKLAIFANDPLVAQPGEKYVYSTHGYSLAGLVMEAAAGKTFPALVDEYIFKPAGLEDIAVDDMFALVDNRSEFYDSIADYAGLLPAQDYGPIVNAFFLNSAYKIPAGGYVATAEAIARFGALHLAPGFFTQETYELLFREQATNAGEPVGVGLGWRVGVSEDGRRVFQHSGSQQGARAHLAVYPDDGLVIAIMTNLGSRPRDADGLSRAIAAAFLE